MKTVLMIAYFFPPLGGVGAQRITKFVRYLPEWGWQPVVLSVSNSPYPLRDPELATQVPAQTPIFRARTLEPEHLYPLYLRLAGRRRSPSHSQTHINPPRHSAGPSWAARLVSWFFVPDGRIGWYGAAVKKGQQAIRQTKPAAIFSTSAPYTAHLVAQTLAKWSGLPWIMDLRDAWVGNHLEQPPTQLHCHLHSYLERTCVRRASRVICVTPFMSQTMCSRYPDQPASKFATITNGYDPSDYEPAVRPVTDRFLMRYVGSLYAGQGPLAFLRGLSLALEQQPMLKRYVQVEFIGMMDQANRQDWESFIHTHALAPWVTSRPFVPHRQAIQLMQTSHVQILVQAPGERAQDVYNAKIFEYMGARRPILAVVSPGATADLIRETQSGLVADQTNPQSVADAILRFFTWFQEGKLQDWPAKGIEVYDRRHLTAQLAEMLETVVMPKR